MKELKILAAVLLKGKYPEFEEKLAELQASGQPIFSYDDMDFQNPFTDKKDEDAYDINYFLLFWADRKYQMIEMIDWSGEYDENQFLDYAKRRLAVYGKPDFPMDFWLTRIDKILADPNLERGDFIAKQFEIFSQELRLNGFFLLFVQEGSDQYYPFIVDEADYLKVVGLKVGDFEIEEDCG